MAQYKDNAGKSWNIEINVGAIKRVRDLTSVDIYKLTADGLKGFGELMADIVKLVDVLYVLLKPQLEAAKVSEEAFAESLAGDALERASDALVEAVIDFFPNAQARESLRAYVGKRKAIGQNLLTMGLDQLKAIDPLEEAKRLSRSFTNSPGSSESAPTPTPSDS